LRRQVEQPAPEVLAHDFRLNRGIEPGVTHSWPRAAASASSPRTPLGLAAKGEQQRHQPHRRVGLAPAQAVRASGRSLATSTAPTDPRSPPAASARGPDRCPRHVMPTGPAAALSLNSAPPLGWLLAVSLPPWRSTMP
jgi:hypothetical protein